MRRSPGTTHLEVVARVAPELIERLGRVLRHRGAVVEQLTFAADAGASGALIHADVRCAGPIELVVAQLERLPDVRSVRAS